VKSFILYLAGLLAALVLALLVNDVVWFKLLAASTGSSAAKIYRVHGHHPTNEIPIFGSSRAQSNFVPEIFGENVFDYGVDGAVQNETLDLIEEYLKYDNHAGMTLPIIVNVDPWGFPADDSEMKVADYGLVDGSLPGVRSFGKFRKVFAEWLNERVGGTKKISRGAVLQLNSRTTAEWETINAKLKPCRFHVSEFWKSRIERVAASTSRQIYWVIGPCAPHWKALFENESDLNSFCAWLARVPNQHVVNLYSLDFGNECFMDPTHLNVEGAHRFSRLAKDVCGDGERRKIEK